MRDLRYEYKGTNAYLVYTLDENDVIDSLSLGMLINNEIEGIIPTQFVQMDNTQQILFDVSGRVPVAQLIKSTVNRRRLIGILSGVVTALLSADEYMLEPQSFLLELDHIFVDMKTAETAVICMPLEGMVNNNQGIKTFIKDIIYQAQFDQTEGYDHIAQILNYVNSNADLSLVQFQKLLNNLSNPQRFVNPIQEDRGTENQSEHEGTSSHELHNDPSNTSNSADANGDNSSNVHQDDSDDAEPEISLYELLSKFNSERYEKYKAQQKRKKEKRKGKEPSPKKAQPQATESEMGFAIPGYEERMVMHSTVETDFSADAEKITPQTEHIDYGETVLLGDDKGTTQVLPGNMGIQPHLIWQRNGEKVYINAEHFLIGRKQSDVNYCIRNNKTVGRVHAEVITRDGAFFVRDLESANHTYVNGVEIPPNQDVPLIHGSRIVFSDEEFEFCLV